MNKRDETEKNRHFSNDAELHYYHLPNTDDSELNHEYCFQNKELYRSHGSSTCARLLVPVLKSISVVFDDLAH